MTTAVVDKARDGFVGNPWLSIDLVSHVASRQSLAYVRSPCQGQAPSGYSQPKGEGGGRRRTFDYFVLCACMRTVPCSDRNFSV
jgi:hypothetical protein